MKFFRKFNTLAIVLAATAATLSFNAGAAKAELKPVYDKLQLYSTLHGTPTIEVAAKGKDWTDVTTDKINVKTAYYVSLKKGKIITISALYEHYPIGKSRHPGGGKWRKGEFSIEMTSAQFGPLKYHAINACNVLKKNGARTDEQHTTYIPIPFRLFVRAERVGNQSTKTVPGNVQAKIICKKAPVQLEISHLDLVIKSSSNKCPKDGEVEVGFKTNRGDKIAFRLEHANRGLHTTYHTAQPFLISGQYVATKRIKLTVDKNTDYIRIRLQNGNGSKTWYATGANKITCPPLKILSVWMTQKTLTPGSCPGKFERKITVTTNGPDSFGYKVVAPSGTPAYSGEGADAVRAKLEGNKYVFTTTSTATYNEPLDFDRMAIIKNHPANSGWVKLKADCVKQEEVKMAVLDVKTPKCEREARIIAQIQTDSPGEMAYQLDCASQVKSWSFKGIVKAKLEKGKYYTGIGHPLDISKTQHVNCALKRKTLTGHKLIALKGHKFQCVKTNPDVAGGPDGIVSESHAQPKKPATVIIHELEDNSPKCKIRWRKQCDTKPVKKCQKVVKNTCKKLPEKTCKIKLTKSCKRVQKRICKEFRGKKVCKTKWVKKCTPERKKICKVTFKKKCERTRTNKCKVTHKKTCKRVPQKICRR